MTNPPNTNIYLKTVVDVKRREWSGVRADVFYTISDELVTTLKKHIGPQNVGNPGYDIHNHIHTTLIRHHERLRQR